MTSEERFKEYWDNIQKGICPRCNQPMTLEQKGRCVYAIPCNHRLYQGRIASEM